MQLTFIVRVRVSKYGQPLLARVLTLISFDLEGEVAVRNSAGNPCGC
jgi:hypothetical protein